MTTYTENNLHTTIAELSTNPVRSGIAEIAEHDFDFVSGGTKTVSGDKIVVKSNGDIECTGKCTVTVS